MAQVETTTRAAVCIFEKPPVAGAVKTRLIPAVGAERAAELAEAFLQDTLAVVRKFGRAEAVIAATAPFAREYMKDPDVAGGCFLSRWSGRSSFRLIALA